MPFDICAGFAFYLYSKEVFADLSDCHYLLSGKLSVVKYPMFTSDIC